ncbi:MAG: nucleotidyltransferase domain-containing protein [Acidobacteriia bacterium]|nr:nucleotidyltransferase domain-containing protein [Terriglobia bacterium]
MIAEQNLADLVTRLKNAAGSNLLSVILYGSAATGEFHPGHSDLNVLCIMQSLSGDDLSKLHAASAWWAKKGHPAPLFFTLSELQHSADIFAIELLDIKAAHRVLHGEDVIASLHVPMDLHRLHVERELRNNTLRLRQRYVMHPADSRKTLELMTSSISTFAALFRHALIALGEDPPPTKRTTMDRMGSVLGFDPSPFHTIFEIREGRKRERDVDVQATFDAYLDRVAKVTEEIDRRLAVPPANG